MMGVEDGGKGMRPTSRATSTAPASQPRTLQLPLPLPRTGPVAQARHSRPSSAAIPSSTSSSSSSTSSSTGRQRSTPSSRTSHSFNGLTSTFPESPAPSSPSGNFNVPKALPFRRCRKMHDAYEKLGGVGQGQFGVVWKCQNRVTREIVALKKVIMKNETEGFPMTAMREIKIMSQVDHKNVLALREVVHSDPSSYNRELGDVFLVFEYMEHDLGGLLNSGIEYSVPEIKCLTKQLFEGLHYLHSKSIMHRDLKAANLLLNNKGILKIADFGLSRFTDSKLPKYSRPVCTRWYRPPEVLLGEKEYSFPIDVWSAACVVAELFTGVPILQGGVVDAEKDLDNDIDQFLEICKLCGSPDPSRWTKMKTLPYCGFILPKAKYPRTVTSSFTKRFLQHCPSGVAFCDELLQLIPEERPTASKALDHRFFWEDPMPCKPEEMRKLIHELHDATTTMHQRRRPPKKYRARVANEPPVGTFPPPHHHPQPPSKIHGARKGVQPNHTHKNNHNNNHKHANNNNNNNNSNNNNRHANNKQHPQHARHDQAQRHRPLPSYRAQPPHTHSTSSTKPASSLPLPLPLPSHSPSSSSSPSRPLQGTPPRSNVGQPGNRAHPQTHARGHRHQQQNQQQTQQHKPRAHDRRSSSLSHSVTVSPGPRSGTANNNASPASGPRSKHSLSHRQQQHAHPRQQHPQHGDGLPPVKRPKEGRG